MKRLARLSRAGRVTLASGVLTLAALVLAAGSPYFSNASFPPRTGIAVIDIELVRSVDDVDRILGEAPSPDREVMRLKQYIDFGLIVGYLGVLLGWAAQVKGPWSKLGAPVAMLCALGAGVFDVLENRAVLAVLDVPLRFTHPEMLQAIRSASTARFLLFAVSVVLLVILSLKGSHEQPSAGNSVSRSV